MAKSVACLCCMVLLACSKFPGTERAKLEREAEQGDAFAQCKLAVMFANGSGVPKDEAKAAEWFQKAAVQGDARAQSALGCMYFSGRGVPMDYIKAVTWLQKAANQGSAFAQRELGILYMQANASPKDHVRAYAWFDVAISNGDQIAAEARDQIEQVMTSEQKMEAQKLSAELFLEIHNQGVFTRSNSGL